MVYTPIARRDRGAISSDLLDKLTDALGGALDLECFATSLPDCFELHDCNQ